MRNRAVLRRHGPGLGFLLATWGLFFVWLFAGALQLHPNGLFVRHYFMWWDWPMHIGMSLGFATKPPRAWFVSHHFFSGGKFSYPFLTNFLSGMLMRLGLNPVTAMNAPSIIYALALVVGLYLLAFVLLEARGEAILAVWLFFLSSGPGFLWFLADLYAGKDLAWARMHEYTRINDYHWINGNVIIGHILPQRAFLLGMTMGAFTLFGLFSIVRQNKAALTGQERAMLGVLGLLAGLLPIAHMHSFIVVTVIAGLVCVTAERKHWLNLLWFVIPAGLLSTVLYLLFVYGAIHPAQFFTWRPGWMAKNGWLGWLKLWLETWGLTLPLACVGSWLVWRRGQRFVRAAIVGFWSLFALANLIWLQPEPWDNAKVFFWAYFGFSAFAAAAATRFWRRSKVLGAVCVFALCATGVLELWRLTLSPSQQILSREEMVLGDKIRANTAPDAVFLTATDHGNLFLAWAGRPIVMGWVPWTVNYGFDAAPRERDMRIMFAGGAHAKALLRAYRISYVAIGANEREEFQTNTAFYAGNFQRAFTGAGYEVYDVRPLWR